MRSNIVVSILRWMNVVNGCLYHLSIRKIPLLLRSSKSEMSMPGRNRYFSPWLSRKECGHRIPSCVPLLTVRKKKQFSHSLIGSIFVSFDGWEIKIFSKGSKLPEWWNTHRHISSMIVGFFVKFLLGKPHFLTHLIFTQHKYRADLASSMPQKHMAGPHQ